MRKEKRLDNEKIGQKATKNAAHKSTQTNERLVYFGPQYIQYAGEVIAHLP